MFFLKKFDRRKIFLLQLERMRKSRFVSLLGLFVFCVGLCVCRGKNIFVVKKDRAVPLFNTRDLKQLPYYVGQYGTSCRNLMSVLSPGSYLKVISKNAEGVYEVSWLRGKKKGNIGYVHEKLLKQCCEQIEEKDIKYGASPMSLKEIRGFFKLCSEQKFPYCWGGNSEDEIVLPEGYGFVQISEDPGQAIKKEFSGKPYRLHGFDCCGLVYHVSGGLLKRTTWGIRNQGMLLHCFDKKSEKISREELAEFLSKLQDTDCIILKGYRVGTEPDPMKDNPGHLATWYNGGILEFRGVDYGCEYRTEQEEVLNRVMGWIERVRKSEDEECDLRFIRWHPELLKEKFTKYFPQEK